MADDIEFKRKQPQAVFEPGTLENTRRNIGMIDPEEAAKMTKVLGGEIFVEKSVPVDYSKLPKRAVQHRSHSKATGQTSAPVSSSSSSSSGSFSQSGTSSSSSGAKTGAGQTAGGASGKKVKHVPDLPSISQKDNQLIDRLMMSAEYNIKKNWGMFNFLRPLMKDGTERVLPGFVEVTLKNHIEHIQTFITVVKTIIQNSPDTYKAKIQNETDLKFRFLRKVAMWNTRDIKLAYVEFENTDKVVLVSELVPFVKAIYKQVITVYYLGDATITQIIKDIYTDIMKYPKANKDKFQMLAKEAITEWVYIHQQCAAGLYPLLMRMCGTSFVTYPKFFTQEISTILGFVGLKKFDLILPEKKKTQEELEAEKKKIEAEKKAAAEPEKPVEEKTEMVKTGLKLLDQMFPQAGFLSLEDFPDMYPYFEPLYELGEPFLYLSPKNPLHITIVLLKILEDFFMACHSIQFNVEANPLLADKRDSIVEGINEFPAYREDLFNRKYAEELKNLVNQTYTQPNFGTTQLGKKTINTLYWQTKYLFLPHFTFEQLLLERPVNDNKYIALSTRLAYMLSGFSDLSRQAGLVDPPNGHINGVENPWDCYHFGIDTPVSKRLDVLLNAKQRTNNVTATNANLIKYITCVIAVLNWWVNAKSSPAYKADPRKIFRVSETDGQPIFSVPEMNSQDKLFAEAVKKMFQERAAA
ncbi:hypothetical protein, partial [Treponema sp.]|uniref:hypothetical protein n=1 Tax=Treponema sp. TaxID=166 RepID=UPI00298DFE71